MRPHYDDAKKKVKPTFGHERDVFATEFSINCKLLPEFPAVAGGLTVVRENWRVVADLLEGKAKQFNENMTSRTLKRELEMVVSERHLFSETAPAEVVRSITFVGFSEEGIEGLTHSRCCCSVTRDREGCDPGQTTHWVWGWNLSGLIQTFGVGQILCHALQKGQWLVEVYLKHDNMRLVKAFAKFWHDVHCCHKIIWSLVKKRRWISVHRSWLANMIINYYAIGPVNMMHIR